MYLATGKMASMRCASSVEEYTKAAAFNESDKTILNSSKS